MLLSLPAKYYCFLNDYYVITYKLHTLSSYVLQTAGTYHFSCLLAAYQTILINHSHTQMDSFVLSKCLILEKALYALDFEPPSYTYEPWNDGLFRCQTKFTTPIGHDEEIPDEIHEVWSGWFPYAEEAKENAAYRALKYLETITTYHVEDYSMSIIKKLRSQNHDLSRQCYYIAGAIHRLSIAWTAMNLDINRAALQTSASITENDTETPNIENKFLVESALHRLNKLSKQLSDLYQQSNNNLHRYHQPIADMVNNHLGLLTNRDTIDSGMKHTNYPLIIYQYQIIFSQTALLIYTKIKCPPLIRRTHIHSSHHSTN